MLLTAKKKATIDIPCGHALVWSPDGGHLAYLQSDAHVVVFDVNTQQEIWSHRRISQSDPRYEQDTQGNTIAWSSDGRFIAVGECGVSWDIGLWHAGSGQLLTTYKDHTYDISDLAFSPDGERVVSVSGVGEAKIWRSRTGETLLSYQEHRVGLGFTSVAWAPSGCLIATGDYQGSIRLWNPNNGETQLIYTGHIQREGSWITSIAFSHDASQIASIQAKKRHSSIRDGSVYWDLSMQVWDVDGRMIVSHELGEVAYSIYDDCVPHSSVAWFPGDQQVFVHGPKALICIIDLQKSIAPLRLPDQSTNCAVRLSPSGSMFATSSDLEQGGLSIWSFS